MIHRLHRQWNTPQTQTLGLPRCQPGLDAPYDHLALLLSHPSQHRRHHLTHARIVREVEHRIGVTDGFHACLLPFIEQADGMGDALAGQAGEIEEDDNVNLPFLLSLSGF